MATTRIKRHHFINRGFRMWCLPSIFYYQKMTNNTTKIEYKTCNICKQSFPKSLEYFCKAGRGKCLNVYCKKCASLKNSIRQKNHRKAGNPNWILRMKWQGMMSRCYKSTSDRYLNYGGRGITVCNEWHKFSNFYKWSLSNGWVKGLSLERVDVNSGYSPSNCKYIPIYEQHLNKTNTVTFLNEKKKKCYFCKIVKSFDEFYKNKNNLAGITKLCKNCSKIKRDIYRKKENKK